MRNEERRGWGLDFWELPRGEGEKPRGKEEEKGEGEVVGWNGVIITLWFVFMSLI